MAPLLVPPLLNVHRVGSLWEKSMCFRNKGHANLSSAMCQLGLEHSTCLANLNLNNTGAVITTLQGLKASEQHLLP